ncbi:MAG: MFS transporter [Erysipelotrichaceae bacterium]|uniref:MFS transporter n=1 Tax=Floccifex sp. TaxID=2815810 RepID=UPI002A756287|nr:MFS transporter [Floccifex sp.]MDD7281043.1 MFS transporter [Erysipelotrichaceae bacterium]MDY2957373.1 MFS transporter [Floccifex sp.]
MEKEKKNKGLRNIVFLGLISCFADISSEMVYPIIPLYLTAVLGTTPANVGIIEGIAESLASLVKVFSGYISDKYQNKKKLAFCGYCTGFIYKIALLVSTSWVGILVARVIDRFGKGIRTAPRDVMVAESTEDNLGTSFGIHKALDMLGSAIGILLSLLILKYFGDSISSYKKIFIVSIIPIVIALFFFIFVKENKNRVQTKKENIFKNVDKLDNQLKLYLFVAVLFTLGNSSNSFLLLRAQDVGYTSTHVILLYFIYNIVCSLLSIPMGKKSDKKGRKGILVKGYLLFSLVYLLFGLGSNKISILLAFVLYGFYTAMIAGVEKAFISEISPKYLKGTMLGLHGTLVGIALLFSSVIAGFLYEYVGSYAPFLLGASLSFITALILQFGLKEQKMDLVK